uniref:DUF2953 domain-containing protein n=1 Tax=Panagrellus redivivus TaxID=6233 RepID=A0A7E4VVJ5_PANRE
MRSVALGQGYRFPCCATPFSAKSRKSVENGGTYKPSSIYPFTCVYRRQPCLRETLFHFNYECQFRFRKRRSSVETLLEFHPIISDTIRSIGKAPFAAGVILKMASLANAYNLNFMHSSLRFGRFVLKKSLKPTIFEKGMGQPICHPFPFPDDYRPVYLFCLKMFWEMARL